MDAIAGMDPRQPFLPAQESDDILTSMRVEGAKHRVVKYGVRKHHRTLKSRKPET